ncbi:wd40 repeat domain 95 [Holotrichia oblita]|uniref:Wd40 repeat domain 95 n=1 Tax=Holotrichia oblita TaxID=644536 RepID=A0ACB9T1C0_HOLOL|nr:wd40 repeat domain 95 [Holotrichia oblita]
MSVVREAHTRTLHGEVLPVEITAATFDPGYQLLLTGAHDGSLKTWNFNTGTCLRNMRIENNCEVTGVVWIKGRILAIGWNRHVTEFADSGGYAGPGGAFSKDWETNHTEDVLCATARVPQTLVTSSYSGELVMWQLETGQAYKCFNVAQPTNRIKLQYKKDKGKDRSKSPHADLGRRLLGRGGYGSKQSRHSSSEVAKGTAMTSTQAGSAIPQQTGLHSDSSEHVKAPRRLTVVFMPKTSTPSKGLPIRAMLFLNTRPMAPNVGTLLVSLENGLIQVWSHHVSGGFITSFSAIHKGGDYVVSMCSDENNEFLFTGTTNGYIKTWLIKDFALPDEDKIHVCMPIYRLMFPFLWRDLFEGKAKRANRGQLKPRLLNCYRGHRMLVSAMAYIDKPQILVTASADFSARLWTLGGRYVGTLGTFKKWKPLDPDTPPGREFAYTIPPDICRIHSATTYKVMMGGAVSRPLTKKQQALLAERELVITDFSRGVYGKRLEEPILGNYFHMPRRTSQRHEFQLDTSFSYIPVYQHMIRPPPQDIQPPKEPDEFKDKTKKKPERFGAVCKIFIH